MTSSYSLKVLLVWGWIKFESFADKSINVFKSWMKNFPGLLKSFQWKRNIFVLNSYWPIDLII